jgi:hypothetical protein
LKLTRFISVRKFNFLHRMGGFGGVDLPILTDSPNKSQWKIVC